MEEEDGRGAGVPCGEVLPGLGRLHPLHRSSIQVLLVAAVCGIFKATLSVKTDNLKNLFCYCCTGGVCTAAQGPGSEA